MEHQRKERPKHRLLESFDKGQHYVPYMSTNQNQIGQQSSTGSTANTYTPGQTGVQGSLGPLWQSFMNGQIPSSFTNPQAALTAYNSNFNTQVAPGMAAAYGAGSPAINSANALGLAQLQGNLYNTGVSNYNNALNSGSNYGLTPTGANTAGMAATASQGTSTTNMNPLGFLLASLLGNG